MHQKTVWRPASLGPAGELKRSPRPRIAAIWGLLLRGRGRRGGREGGEERGEWRGPQSDLLSKPGFHSKARNARKALRKKKYASKIKSAQETQQTQKNTQAKKQKYASASHATDASGPCARKHNDRIDSIFHATHATQALACV